MERNGKGIERNGKGWKGMERDGKGWKRMNCLKGTIENKKGSFSNKGILNIFAKGLFKA